MDFDRQVLVDRPDRIGREQILKVHTRRVILSVEVKLEEVAALTPGFTGADLANLVNEAALVATRRGADQIVMNDFNLAIERIVAGLEKKNRLLNPREREIVAHHEMGHAFVAAALPGSDVVHKISIIPRGIGALGYTIQRPTEDRYLMTREELENKMAVLLGGRAAEHLVFGHLSTGASDDLSKATDIARSMVTRFGMGEALGPVTYETEPTSFLGQAYGSQRLYSEEPRARSTSRCVALSRRNSSARARFWRRTAPSSTRPRGRSSPTNRWRERSSKASSAASARCSARASPPPPLASRRGHFRGAAAPADVSGHASTGSTSSSLAGRAALPFPPERAGRRW